MTTLRIDVHDRLAALTLARRLSRFRTHLVQHGREAWYVAVEADGDGDAATAHVINVLEAWVADGGTDCVLHHGERTYPLRVAAVR